MINSSFGKIPKFLPDTVLNLSKIVKEDKRSNVINATVGFIRDESGEIFIPKVVQQAWKQVKIEPATYLSPKNEYEWLGAEDFIQGALHLILEKTKPEDVASLGTVGGTGAVFSFLMFYARIVKKPEILLSSPTWPNHTGICEHLGYKIKTYQHAHDHQYNFEAHAQAIKKQSAGSVVLFHSARTHNPSGVNPTKHQWKELAKLMSDKVAFFDAAYLGLDTSVTEDSFAFNHFHEQGIPTAVAVSFSKNAGLYNQRTGILLLPQKDRKQALGLQRMLNALARIVYSSPPAQGERVMAQVLSNSQSRSQWQAELEEMNLTIQKRRAIVAEFMPRLGFTSKQFGLFSMLPLNLEQVVELRHKYGVYLTDSGRINLGGVTTKQIPILAESLSRVMNGK